MIPISHLRFILGVWIVKRTSTILLKGKVCVFSYLTSYLWTFNAYAGFIDDTHFRVYQEHISPGYRNASWISVAGSIEELRDLADRLGKEGSRTAKELQGKILAAIPRFEEGEQVRILDNI